MTPADYNLKKQPVQARSRFTVAAIRQASALILKEEGMKRFTTNRVAERAGVSIGSLYQYFPSKKALIAEVKRAHFKDVRRLFEETYRKRKTTPLPLMTKAVIEVSIRVHRADPALHRILAGHGLFVPVREDDRSRFSIRYLIRKILTDHKKQLRPGLNIPAAERIVYKLVEGVIHEAAISSDDGQDTEALARELSLLVMAYLTGPGWP